MDPAADPLEADLTDKLFDWRSRDAKYSSVPESAPKATRDDRKRRKRKRAKLAESNSVANVPAPVPNTKPSPEQVEGVLARALVKTRTDSQWSDLSQGARSRKDLGIVKRRAKASVASKRNNALGHGRSRGRGTDMSQNGVNAARFVEEHRFEVGALGSSGLNKRQKKAYQAAQLLRLGCRAPRNQKMPIAMLIGMRRKQKEREEKEKQKKLEEGVLISSKRKKR